jgi:hypothetical protein
MFVPQNHSPCQIVRRKGLLALGSKVLDFV